MRAGFRVAILTLWVMGCSSFGSDGDDIPCDNSAPCPTAMECGDDNLCHAVDPQTAECGDGVCESPETCDTCADDCGECTQLCGDGNCVTGESCTTCSPDCGECPAGCGDAICDSSIGETCAPDSCPQDCGECCDNGVVNDGEACDGELIGDETCGALVPAQYPSPDAVCNAACTGLDPDTCGGYCGDGIKNGLEECDGPVPCIGGVRKCIQCEIIIVSPCDVRR